MRSFEWLSFLKRYSQELLADEWIRSELAEDVIASGWMGFEPATEQELAKLEQRLSTHLPSSYRTFLATTNGWRATGYFIWEIWPTSAVEWFRISNQDWIDAYLEPAEGEPPLPLHEHRVYGERQDCCRFRIEYLQTCLQISAMGDSAVYLLNPEVRTTDGEWETWFFANWLPGAKRYRSFREMMEEELRSFIQLRKEHR